MLHFTTDATEKKGTYVVDETWFIVESFKLSLGAAQIQEVSFTATNSTVHEDQLRKVNFLYYLFSPLHKTVTVIFRDLALIFNIITSTTL